MDLIKSEALALSRLFSVAVVRDFGKRARSPLFARLIKQTRLIRNVSPDLTVGTTLDQAFKLLKNSAFRSDYVYRSAITQKILLGRHNLNTATLLNEVRAGSCKADVVVLNRTSTAYEIKSERDSLVRLKKQTESYRQVFATVNVVVSKSHLSSVLQLIADDVGVIALSERFTFQTIREAQNLPERLKPTMVLDLLRFDEVIEILHRLGREAPEVPNTMIRSEFRRIFDTLDPIVVHEEMVKTLRGSRSQANLASFISSIPASVRAASLAANPSFQDRLRFKEAVDTPLIKALAWM